RAAGARRAVLASLGRSPLLLPAGLVLPARLRHLRRFPLRSAVRADRRHALLLRRLLRSALHEPRLPELVQRELQRGLSLRSAVRLLQRELSQRPALGAGCA